MQSHALDGDGLNLELFKLLGRVSKTSVVTEHLPFRLPDTILYYGCASFWYYFDDTTNSVQKYPAKQLEKQIVFEKFCKKKPTDKSDTLAYFSSSKSESMEITYFDKAGLYEFLFGEKKERYGILQKFIEPKISNCETIQVVHSPTMSFALRRQNHAKLYDRSVPINLRSCTFDGPSFQSEEFFCLTHRTSTYKQMCDALMEFFTSIEPRYLIKRLVAYFRQDSDDVQWLLFTSSVRIVERTDPELEQLWGGKKLNTQFTALKQSLSTVHTLWAGGGSSGSAASQGGAAARETTPNPADPTASSSSALASQRLLQPLTLLPRDASQPAPSTSPPPPPPSRGAVSSSSTTLSIKIQEETAAARHRKAAAHKGNSSSASGGGGRSSSTGTGGPVVVSQRLLSPFRTVSTPSPAPRVGGGANHAQALDDDEADEDEDATTQQLEDRDPRKALALLRRRKQKVDQQNALLRTNLERLERDAASLCRTSALDKVSPSPQPFLTSGAPNSQQPHDDERTAAAEEAEVLSDGDPWVRSVSDIDSPTGGARSPPHKRRPVLSQTPPAEDRAAAGEPQVQLTPPQATTATTQPNDSGSVRLQAHTQGSSSKRVHQQPRSGAGAAGSPVASLVVADLSMTANDLLLSRNVSAASSTTMMSMLSRKKRQKSVASLRGGMGLGGGASGMAGRAVSPRAYAVRPQALLLQRALNADVLTAHCKEKTQQCMAAAAQLSDIFYPLADTVASRRKLIPKYQKPEPTYGEEEGRVRVAADDGDKIFFLMPVPLLQFCRKELGPFWESLHIRVARPVSFDEIPSDDCDDEGEESSTLLPASVTQDQFYNEAECLPESVSDDDAWEDEDLFNQPLQLAARRESKRKSKQIALCFLAPPFANQSQFTFAAGKLQQLAKEYEGHMLRYPSRVQARVTLVSHAELMNSIVLEARRRMGSDSNNHHGGSGTSPVELTLVAGQSRSMVAQLRGAAALASQRQLLSAGNHSSNNNGASLSPMAGASAASHSGLYEPTTLLTVKSSQGGHGSADEGGTAAGAGGGSGCSPRPVSARSGQ